MAAGIGSTTSQDPDWIQQIWLWLVQLLEGWRFDSHTRHSKIGETDSWRVVLAMAEVPLSKALYPQL